MRTNSFQVLPELRFGFSKHTRMGDSYLAFRCCFFVLFYSKKKRFSLDPKRLLITLWGLKIIFALMALYIILMVYWLNEIGLWKVHQLKNTIIWAVSVGVLFLFQHETIKKEPQVFLKKTIVDNLKVAAIIQFIVGFYTFNLVGELIMLPVLVGLGGTLALAQSDKKFNFFRKAYKQYHNRLCNRFNFLCHIHVNY